MKAASARLKGNRVNIPEPGRGIGLGPGFGQVIEANAVTQTYSETSARVLGRVVFSL
jgi:hypothetical protein